MSSAKWRSLCLGLNVLRGEEGSAMSACICFRNRFSIIFCHSSIFIWFLICENFIKWVMSQKSVSRAWTSNYTPQYLIICSFSTTSAPIFLNFEGAWCRDWFQTALIFSIFKKILVTFWLIRGTQYRLKYQTKKVHLCVLPLVTKNVGNPFKTIWGFLSGPHTAMLHCYVMKPWRQPKKRERRKADSGHPGLAP